MKPVMCEKKTYTVAEIMQILGIEGQQPMT